jgi:hypothetical protein
MKHLPDFRQSDKQSHALAGAFATLWLAPLLGVAGSLILLAMLAAWWELRGNRDLADALATLAGGVVGLFAFLFQFSKG